VLLPLRYGILSCSRRALSLPTSKAIAENRTHPYEHLSYSPISVKRILLSMVCLSETSLEEEKLVPD